MRRHLWTAPAALAAALLIAVTATPAVAGPVDDPADDPRPVVTLPVDPQMWPHRQICTEGKFTAYSAGRATPGAGLRVQLSLEGWIAPCTGQSAAGAAYDFVHYAGSRGVLGGSGIPFASPTGVTAIRGQYTGAGSDWALCLIDYAEGPSMAVRVSKVACLAVNTDAGSGRVAVTSIPVDDPRVSVPVRQRIFPGEEHHGFCGSCM